VWTVRIYPELGRVPTTEERRAIRRKAWRRCGNRPIVVLGALAIVVCMILLPGPVRSFLSEHLPVGGRYVHEVVGGALAAFVGGGLCCLLWRGPLRRAVREEMQARGYAICVECGYDLAGLSEPRCPECGKAF